MSYVSNNLEWGFSGTSQTNFGLSNSDTASLFDLAAQHLISEAALTPVEAVVYLDATYGRHDADGMTWFGAKEGLSVGALSEIAKKYFAEHQRQIARAVRAMRVNEPKAFLVLK